MNMFGKQGQTEGVGQGRGSWNICLTFCLFVYYLFESREPRV